ncbi:hypothetical protein Rhe02_82120 [Rhizocola hellebori]|uniref:ATP/GTP-binding protein n=1 Tax=Rhizocola hellebori TaxID=1392758 RepID=A0A8J3QI61_9ACTN|nr:hypothetical protein Rhe02_82120 [Rhizocola hellebori]
MSPRRNNRRDEPGKPDPAPTRFDEIEGEFRVRHLSGETSTKMYRCPGCDQEIRPGVPHVVAWPLEGWGDESDRRHWHTSCWRARGRRGPSSARW